MAASPTKSDIMQIFKRLRSVSANKICYDCGSKNPTWASITYGIFICIDCSGIHRSLGVHLTFIRSTNLDTNWSWHQLRQMQLGGNAKASSFFRSHNCVTTDTQQKYNSRAAQLYREKLSQAAAQAMRIHGDKLHIDGGNEEGENKEEKEEDFFSSNTTSEFPESSVPVVAEVAAAVNKNSTIADIAEGAPDVSKALSEPPSKPAPRKSTIGAKKAGGKKPGLGAKKGLGAQKVTKDFAEIEREAEMADNIVLARKEEARISAAKSEEEQAASMASMRLAYQDLSIQQKKKEQALSKMDPKKAQQMERLGMGFGSGGGFGAEKSHSLISDMGVIKQEEPGNARKPQFQSSTKDKFFDDFEVVENENDDNSWGSSSNSRVDNICAPSNNSSKSAWEQDLSESVSKNGSKSSSWDNDFDSKPKKAPTPISSGPAGVEAVNKFGNAKSISSDMFFGSDSASDRDANLNRFQGSNSISSDMYFNREGGSMNKSQSYTANLQAPDMEDVKESVRQGVTKVAGRLSGMASGVMNQIQDKYGY